MSEEKSMASVIAGLSTPAQLSEEMSKMKIIGGEEPQGPLTKFELFPNLASEIRLKIWGYLINQQRIIEIQDAGHHEGIKLAKESRKIPAVLHVNKEAREEALKTYTVTHFELRLGHNLRRRPIYYNTTSDILYFGENSCKTTMVHTFRRLKEIVIERVAISVDDRMNTCCDEDASGPTLIQILHSFRPEEGNTYSWTSPGCKGLKEVFFIVQSNLWYLPPGKIPAHTGLRPAVTDGITREQERFKKSLEKQISDVEADKGLWCFASYIGWHWGKRKWIGETKPTFRFKSLAHPNSKYEACDEVTADPGIVSKLSIGDWKFLRDLEDCTGCIIAIASSLVKYRQEIGFAGSVAGVERAKKEFEDFFARNRIELQKRE